MTIDESKIREAFEEKNWAEIKSQDSWSVFKIMSEFVTGYETLSKIGPCVAIFGSARTKPDNKYYKMAEAAYGGEGWRRKSPYLHCRRRKHN